MSLRPPRVLAIASKGGHWTQLRRIRPAFEGCEVIWACTDPSFLRECGDARTFLVPDASRWDRLRLVHCALRVVLLVLRVRPDVIVSTGAAPGFFALRAGKLVGARTLWIDSIANAEELSMSGRRASRFANLTLTQWPELGKPLPPHGPREPGTVYHAGAVV